MLRKRLCPDCSGDRCFSSCSLRGGCDKFSKDGWDKPDEVRKCKSCTPKRCPRRTKNKTKSSSSRQQRLLPEGRGVWTDCDRRRCGKRNKAKTVKKFAANMWDKVDGSKEAHCRECAQGSHKTWRSNKRCKQQKPHAEFAHAIAKYGPRAHWNAKVCDSFLRGERRKQKRCQKESGPPAEEAATLLGSSSG